MARPNGTQQDDGERRSPDEALTASIAAMIGRLADRPQRLSAFLNGLGLDGTLKRLNLPAGLAPMMRLPAPEPERMVRARMADLIVVRFGTAGNVTREDLLSGGFSEDEITRHFHGAKRIAQVARQVA